MQLKKSILFGFSALLLAIGPSGVLFASAETVEFGAKISADALVIRGGAGKTYKKLGTLYKGDKVQVYEQKNGWDRIGEGQRWVMDQYLEKSALENGEEFSAKVTADVLVVRSGPGKTYKKISQMQKGKTVTVYGSKNGWYRISTGEKWVNSDYVTKALEQSVVKKPIEAPVAKVSSEAPADSVDPWAESSEAKVAAVKPVSSTSKPSMTCMQAIASANAFCSKIAKGCPSYSKTEKCVSANAQCEEQQREALSICPQQ